MHVLIVGLGSIGKRHLANVRTLRPNDQITALRHEKSSKVVPQSADGVCFSIEDAIAAKPDVAFVCWPTTRHADVAVALAQSGTHLFIEKPLAAKLSDALRIVQATERANVQLVVGYNLRFLPSMCALKRSLDAGEIGRPMTVRAEVGQYLPDWRPGTDYRLGNTARAELGGGIEFELSHELDYVAWLCGNVRSIHAVFGQTSDLEIEGDDTAEIILQFVNGMIGSIHLDITQRAVTRTCQIAGTNGTLHWDGIAGNVRRYRPEDGWHTIFTDDGDRNAMYIAEAKHVFDCVESATASHISGTVALRAVELAVAARHSSNEQRRIAL